MIRDIVDIDIPIINELGCKYDAIFCNHYSLDSYINNDIYVLKCYEDNNSIKGFIMATKMYENIEILLVYVDNDYRKEGIGTQLLKSLEEFNDIQNILLEVSVNNIPAIELYKKMGYTIESKREKYYNGIDAYIMKKVLK